ncbi:MAG: trypsin-like peptidase domain-containing protein [Pirellulales bacterium]
MKRLIVCCVFSSVLGGFLASWLVQGEESWSFAPVAAAQAAAFADTTQASTSLAQPSSLTQEELTNIRVYESTNRGVVNILTRSVGHEGFFMLPSHEEGAGSGSVLDKRGHILTNNHVIEDAEVILVTLPGAKQPYPAELVGTDVSTDIAVLKINAPASELFPVSLGSSDNLKVGQRVYTLGNPFGFDGTLTTGIISNLNRTLPSRKRGREMKSIIQTDAAMNPGNSGGPLLDTAGRMVGMNVAIASMSGQSSGLGFAIPVNRIRQVVPQLIQRGKVVRADIGIVAVNEIDQGLQVVRTNSGGPADQAGLRGWGIVRRRVNRGPIAYNVEQEDRSKADIIVAVDGKTLHNASEFIELIEQRQPGEKVVLSVLRDGRDVQVEVTLGAA